MKQSLDSFPCTPQLSLLLQGPGFSAVFHLWITSDSRCPLTLKGDRPTRLGQGHLSVAHPGLSIKLEPQENRNIFCLDKCNKLISHLAEQGHPSTLQVQHPGVSRGRSCPSPAPTAQFRPHRARNSTPSKILAWGGREKLGWAWWDEDRRVLLQAGNGPGWAGRDCPWDNRCLEIYPNLPSS